MFVACKPTTFKVSSHDRKQNARVPPGSPQACNACGAEFDVDWCQQPACRAERGRQECANEVGGSRRSRRMRTCGTDSTRIHHAGMKRPAVGAAVTERWSEAMVRDEARHRTADNFGTTSWSEGRAGSRARPSRQMLTASELIEPDDDSDKRDVGGCLRVV